MSKNNEQAKTRRAARKAAREVNVEKAFEQERQLTSNINELKRLDADKPKPAEKMPQRERVKKERVVAEERAAEQERHLTSRQSENVETNLEVYVNSRENVPLHVLNQIAREQNEQRASFAKDVATAAGKAAFGAAGGIEQRRGPSVTTRFNRVRDAQAARAAMQKQEKSE